MKDRIKKIRADAGLSMEKFGERIGVTRSSISLLESGKNSPSEQTIKLICKEFNVNEEWLRTGEGEMNQDFDMDFGAICADIGINDPKAKEALMKYYALNEEDKKLFWEWLERFTKI